MLLESMVHVLDLKNFYIKGSTHYMYFVFVCLVSVRSGQVRNLESARVSMVGQVKR